MITDSSPQIETAFEQVQPKAEMLVIRHGKTNYLEKGKDITQEGEEETILSAKKWADYLSTFDCIIPIASPAARTLATAQVFLNTLGKNLEVRESLGLRPIEVKDLEGFKKFENENSTKVYGEMWLTHPFLAEDNPLTSARNKVEDRSLSFLDHYGNAILRIAENAHRSVCAIVFTHFEIGSYYIKGLYPNTTKFPSLEIPGLANSEGVLIGLNSIRNNELTIKAREDKKIVRLDITDKRRLTLES